MRILMPIDGTAHSSITIQEFLNRSWPAGTQVEVLSVALAGSKLSYALRLQRRRRDSAPNRQLERARADAERAAEQIRQASSIPEVSAKVMEGSAADVILREAVDWGSDLILMGSHGPRAAVRRLRRSVAHSVASHAPCKVEVVRKPRSAHSS
jgi:nucleotide-binding universal stress UspA family protein